MDIKISELELTDLVKNGCCFPLVQDEETKRVEYATIKSDIIDSIYPVGAIYISVNSTNPSTYFGGVWEQIKDVFLLSAGDIYPNGQTGGEKEVTLTHETMPSHAHNENIISNYGYPNYMVGNYANIPDNKIITSATGGYLTGGIWKSTAGIMNQTNKTGGGRPHNNMPPYVAVSMFKRIA